MIEGATRSIGCDDLFDEAMLLLRIVPIIGIVSDKEGGLERRGLLDDGSCNGQERHATRIAQVELDRGGCGHLTIL